MWQPVSIDRLAPLGQQARARPAQAVRQQQLGIEPGVALVARS